MAPPAIYHDWRTWDPTSTQFEVVKRKSGPGYDLRPTDAVAIRTPPLKAIYACLGPDGDTQRWGKEVKDGKYTVRMTTNPTDDNPCHTEADAFMTKLDAFDTAIRTYLAKNPDSQTKLLKDRKNLTADSLSLLQRMVVKNHEYEGTHRYRYFDLGSRMLQFVPGQDERVVVPMPIVDQTGKHITQTPDTVTGGDIVSTQVYTGANGVNIYVDAQGRFGAQWSFASVCLLRKSLTGSADAPDLAASYGDQNYDWAQDATSMEVTPTSPTTVLTDFKNETISQFSDQFMTSTVA